MILFLFSIILCVASAGIFIWVYYVRDDKYALLAKTLASLAFVISGVLASINLNNYFTAFALILIGLIFAFTGDILLGLKISYKKDEKTYLNFGMLSFGAELIAYIVGISMLANNFLSLNNPFFIALGCTPLMVVIVLFSSKLMKLDFKNFFWQTVAYTALLSFATLFCFVLTLYNVKFLLFFLGVLMILLSDLALSTLYFGKDAKNQILKIVNHVLYYAGQILIVSFMFTFFW